MKNLEYEKNDQIAVVNIFFRTENTDDPEDRLEETITALEKLRYDDQTTALVINFAGPPKKNSQMISNSSLPQNGRSASGIQQSIAPLIAEIEIPVIACLEGDLEGRELEWFLASDIRIAGGSSCFSMPQVSQGSLPCEGGTQRLTRIVGQGKAMEMILTGCSIKALEAQEIGLVNQAVPDELVLKTALELAETIVSKSTISMRFAKEAILKGMDMTLDQGLRLEADLYFLMQTTEDRKEGIQAFQEKRKAQFNGR